MSSHRCFCPDDCTCHYPWRPTLCGCRQHDSGTDAARDAAAVLTAEDIAALSAIEPFRLCSETCAPHLHQHCSPECETLCAACSP